MDTIEYYDIEYTLKHANGKTASFYHFPAHANIEASSEEEAVEKLQNEWWSWMVEVHNIVKKTAPAEPAE